MECMLTFSHLARWLCGFTLATQLHADLTLEQQQVPLEQIPASSSTAARIVLIAGTPSNKPGQHEYFAGCALLRDWLSQVPGVAPILVAEGWPKNEAVLEGAAAVLLFMDGGTKLSFLTPDRWARMQALADAGVGLAILHQGIDCPAEHASTFQTWFGAAFQPDIGCRGHWDVTFDHIPTHPITHSMKPFDLLKDGWLYNLHFAHQGVTPLLACAMPESSRKTADAKSHAGRAETVAWAYQRPRGGRSFGFTGCDLHANWADANQRLLVLNGLLWTAHLDAALLSAAPSMSEADLKKNWDRKLFVKKPAADK